MKNRGIEITVFPSYGVAFLQLFLLNLGGGKTASRLNLYVLPPILTPILPHCI